VNRPRIKGGVKQSDSSVQKLGAIGGSDGFLAISLLGYRHQMAMFALFAAK
jgi:hypothetical protein